MASQDQLDFLQRETNKLERSLKGLELTITQIQQNSSQPQSQSQSQSSWNSNNKSHVSNLGYLKEKLQAIKKASESDDKEMKQQRETMKEQSEIINKIRTELVTLREKVSNYVKNSNKNDDGSKLRQVMRERLLLIQSEVIAMDANREASLISKRETKNVKVHYWNGRGLCEPLRLMLAALNIEFENVFIKNRQDLENVRSKVGSTFDQLPLIEIDNLKLTQSGAAMRYLARRGGMYGDSDNERYTIDLVYEGARDARRPMTSYWAHGGGIDNAKNNMKEERYFGAWEQLLKSSKSGYFVTHASMADIAVFEVLGIYIDTFGKDTYNKTMKQYPHLKKLRDSVYKIGAISKYIEKQRNHLPQDQYQASVEGTLPPKK